MNYRYAAVVSVVASLMAGCAYLPTGHSSRTGQWSGNADSTDQLFSSAPETQLPAVANNVDPNRPVSGLKVRQSKRGNMDSYVVRGQRYYTMDSSDGYSARGLASWYGPNFHGRTASNGEVYDMYKMTAAHKTLPLPTYARVTHIDNGKSIIVKINDRGPFSGDRLIDLSFAAALELGMVNDGTAMVEIQALSPKELMVLSGPKNTLGVEFYYDNSTPVKTASIPLKDLFTDAEPPALNDDTEDTLATLDQPAVQADPGGELIELTEASVAGDNASSAEQPMVVADATLEPLGVAVEVPELGPEYLKVVVPGRNRSAEAESVAGSIDESGDIFPAETKTPNAVIVASAKDDPAAGVDIPLIDTAVASPSIGTGTMPTLSAPAKADSDHRYYIQAGVFADVKDAEKLAIDIVLEIPREEVHVKPLKDSRMYRVTVGPIVNNEHAQTVSTKLSESGVENYTVKVKEL